MSGIKRDKRDRVFSKIVRTRDSWTCQRCGGRYAPGPSANGLDCSHFHGRRHKGLRWSELNCDALCRGCHQYFSEHPNLYREWKTRRIGQEAMDRLDYLASTTTKYTPYDLEMLYSELKLRLRQLEERGDAEEDF